MPQHGEDVNTVDAETTCELLDKLILKQLHLMEEKVQCELNIETSINNGSFHLAKCRYIMGQSSVSTARLPVENSPEFSALAKCEIVEEDGVRQLKLVEGNGENTVNPLHWFGVLVPQNLHKARGIFHNAINYVVECANVQLQLDNNLKNIYALKKYKNML